MFEEVKQSADGNPLLEIAARFVRSHPVYSVMTLAFLFLVVLINVFLIR